MRSDVVCRIDAVRSASVAGRDMWGDEAAGAPPLLRPRIIWSLRIDCWCNLGGKTFLLERTLLLLRMAWRPGRYGVTMFPEKCSYRRYAQHGFGATVNPGQLPHVDFKFNSMSELVEAHQRKLGTGLSVARWD